MEAQVWCPPFPEVDKDQFVAHCLLATGSFRIKDTYVQFWEPSIDRLELTNIPPPPEYFFEQLVLEQLPNKLQQSLRVTEKVSPEPRKQVGNLPLIQIEKTEKSGTMFFCKSSASSALQRHFGGVKPVFRYGPSRQEPGRVMLFEHKMGGGQIQTILHAAHVSQKRYVKGREFSEWFDERWDDKTWMSMVASTSLLEERWNQICGGGLVDITCELKQPLVFRGDFVVDQITFRRPFWDLTGPGYFLAFSGHIPDTTEKNIRACFYLGLLIRYVLLGPAKFQEERKKPIRCTEEVRGSSKLIHWTRQILTCQSNNKNPIDDAGLKAYVQHCWDTKCSKFPPE